MTLSIMERYTQLLQYIRREQGLLSLEGFIDSSLQGISKNPYLRASVSRIACLPHFFTRQYQVEGVLGRRIVG